MDDRHVSSSSTSTRRGRGCAKGIKEWGTGKKLDIQFDGNYCPIGDNDNLNICPEEYKPICMKNCNSIWKDHKNKLKAKYFKPRSSDPNLKDDVPMHIVPC
ncbi:hypothetical protein CsSME_00018624 [Camellia sinensis var. sinensis]